MLRTSLLLTALVTATAVFADTACSINSKCPSATPCCSQYGQCGAGAYCLGGCDPRASFSLKSCVPEPVCESRTTNFNNMDRITSKTEYLGDSSKTDWVMDGNAQPYGGDSVLLTMAEGTVGTLLASSTYMWYGSVEATFKTSRGAGVVTAFILLSDVKDEIDYEFVGVDLQTAQTNFYYQGFLNYDNSANISLSNTFANYHTYKIDWTPDTITWYVDGQVGRVKNRKDTWNATSNQWDFPQTPSRVQLSLWPAGLPTNGQGTIDWAGGEIQWDTPDIKSAGYYYAAFKSVTINCYDAKNGLGTNSGKSYTYNNYAGTNNTVVDGDGDTVLKSFLGTGTDMDAGAPTASGSAAVPSSTVETIPGLSGGGVGGTNGQQSSGGSSSNSGSDSGSSGSSESSSVDSASGSTSTGSSSSSNGFTQGDDSSTSTSTKSSDGVQERVIGSSVFAGIVAVVAMMTL